MKTLILFSGGLDSTVVLAQCLKHGDECEAVAFNYGQPHSEELNRATLIADYYGVPLEIEAVPAMPRTDDVGFAGRNLVLAAMAISIAQARGFDRIVVGCNATDWPRFPDCRPQFWRDLAKCAEVYGIGVEAPLIYMSKRDVVDAARKLDVPIDLTWSCYSPMVSVIRGHIGEPVPCGECLACKTRNEALKCEVA